MAGKRPIKGQQGVTRSFVHAYDGLLHAVRTQRNMRFHVVAATLVLIASLLLGVSRLELALLILVILVVFVTEMLNTALEFTVDLVTSEYHPLAKLAKDIAAGAVFVSSIGAVLVGYLILSDNLGPLSIETVETIRREPPHLTLVALGVVVLLVVIGKALAHSPRSPYGGMPSGHAAVAFTGWVAVSFVAAGGRHGGLVSLVALLMALLVCQSRMRGGIQDFYRVTTGALLGALVTVAAFQLF